MNSYFLSKAVHGLWGKLKTVANLKKSMVKQKVCVSFEGMEINTLTNT